MAISNQEDSKDNDLIIRGVVLKSTPLREFDRRLTVLTRELGRVTVWANGSRRQGSHLLAGTRNFVFADFEVAEAKDGYRLKDVNIHEFFSEISEDLENTCYGGYFLELSDYVCQENLDSGDMVNLIYLSLKALLNPRINNRLIKAVFELRLLYIGGEYTESPLDARTEACRYAWQYVISCPIGRLYTFVLNEEAEKDFIYNTGLLMRRLTNQPFKSLNILRSLGVKV